MPGSTPPAARRRGGRDVFVHHSAIRMDGYRTLEQGRRVEFEITQSDRGPQADAVRPH
ncbi:cold shock domain-containing protein [Spirillospora sp. NPDC000708]